MKNQTVHCTCGGCNATFTAEIVVDAPVSVSVASMRVIRCPYCGVGTDKVLLGAQTPDGFKIGGEVR